MQGPIFGIPTSANERELGGTVARLASRPTSQVRISGFNCLNQMHAPYAKPGTEEAMQR